MCLFTKQQEAKIVNKNIIVYKLLYCNNGVLRPPIFSDYVYELKKLNITDIEVSSVLDLGYNIYRAFHAFTTIRNALTSNIIMNDMLLYKCIIPKGSKYYISKDGREIASDKIIIKRKLWFNLI